MVARSLFLLGWVFAALGAAAPVWADQKLIIYTSARESLIGELRAAFIKHHPDVEVEVRAGGAAKLMARIAAERDSGVYVADLLWTGEVADFYQLKSQGMLLPYVPVEIKSVVNPFKDYDGSFTAVRLGLMGIAYNTRFVKEPPKSWHDTYKAGYKNAYGVVNPALSGNAALAVGMLARAFGWGYFEALHANGAKISNGTGALADETATGDLLASMASDSTVRDKVDKGAPLALAYPPEILLLPSSVAIVKGSDSIREARLFIDFMLSREGQGILAEEGKLPVRTDVVLPPNFGLPTPAEAVKRAVTLDFPHLIADREGIVKRFAEIMQKENGDKAEKR
jgi:iron(III) transport system substrate-binding protein